MSGIFPKAGPNGIVPITAQNYRLVTIIGGAVLLAAT